MEDAVELAKSAAYAGGRIVRERIGAITGRRSKSSATDLVSDVDVDAGVAIARLLHNADPSADIVIEEPEVYELAGIEPGSLEASRVWVVDPLDGTTSYLHGFPAYSVSVALLEDGQPEAGAVYNAALDEMNWAGQGLGAYRDGQRLEATSAASLDEALLVTGFPYDRGAPLDRQLAVLAAFLRSPVHGIRRDGSAAIDCCHVAAGRADGFWEFTLLPWDMAAGVVICREAGAKVTDIGGNPWTHEATGIITANPVLHALMLEVVAAVSAASEAR